MLKLVKLLETTVGQKIIAALTGIGLIGFVVVHMLGNLQVFLGQDAINGYAAKIQALGPLLWVARVGLLALVVLHVVITVRLRIRNRAARKGSYDRLRSQTSSRSSRLMIVSGSIILGFVVFHLLHFTFGLIQPDVSNLSDDRGRHDVYAMITKGFQSWWVVGIYLVALMCLFSHLAHASFSVFQTLGIRVGSSDSRFKKLATIVAVVVVIGFSSIPLAALFRLIPSS